MRTINGMLVRQLLTSAQHHEIRALHLCGTDTIAQARSPSAGALRRAMPMPPRGADDSDAAQSHVGAEARSHCVSAARAPASKHQQRHDLQRG